MASNGNLSKEVTEINIYVEFTQDAINSTGVEQLKIVFFLLFEVFKRLPWGSKFPWKSLRYSIS